MIKKDILAFIFITVLTIIALIYGLSIIPSAGIEQRITADQQRVIDLGELLSSFNTYFQTNGELPSSLNKLTSNTDNPNEPLEKTDPLTKKAYGYRIISASAGIFQLCADFSYKALATNTNNDTGVFASSLYDTYESQFSHPAGYYCFNESIGQPVPSENPYPSSVSPAPSNAYPEPSDTSPTPAPLPTLNATEGDTKRSGDVSAILNAIYQYAADNAGSLPQNIAGLPVNAPIVINSDNFHNLCNQLVPKYLSSFPVDPIINNGTGVSSCAGSWNTGYMVSRDASNRVTIQAPFTQEGYISDTDDETP